MENELSTRVDSPASHADTLHQSGDALLACLEYLARTANKPFLADAVLNGLPLDATGRLSPQLFPRAAERVGFAATLFERAPSDVPALVMPAVVLFPNGDAAILVGRTRAGRRLEVVFPAISDKPQQRTAKQLDEQSAGLVFYVVDAAREAQQHTSKSPANASAAHGHWFWGPMFRLWPSWLQLTIAAFLINLLGLATPVFVMNVYDRVIPNLAFPTLWALTAGVALALIFDLILRQLRTVLLDQAGQRVDMTVSARVFEHSLDVPLNQRHQTTGEMANQIRDFDSVKEFFSSASVIAIVDLVFVFVFIWFLWLIVGPLAYVPMAAVPIVIVATLLFQWPLSRSVSATQREGAVRNAVLVEGLSAIETVKAVGAESILQKRWEDAVVSNARAASSVRFWSSLALHLTTGAQQTVSVLIILWGVFLVAESAITVGGLIAANILAGRILAPLSNIAMTIARAQHAILALRGVNAFMAIPGEQATEVTNEQQIMAGKIAFQDVSFSYPGAVTPALKELSFTIEPGERVGIVGRVGSGKSTIGRLMSGLHTPSEGTILADGAEIRSYVPAQLRRSVGFVSQEPELFTGTLRDNILIGNPKVPERLLLEAIQVSGVDQFAATHPLGLQMPIGERGLGLSGGQRQAVALARMILRRPKVLFLDEPSSSMDTTTETELINRLHQWAGAHVTLIVCTHRLSFLKLVERIMVIHDGRLVANGPKSQVMAALNANGQAGATQHPAHPGERS